ncbi:hypothetical protein C1752_04089 [Acaryochloris thomasi RCC1774]|uniref:Uncharacterized protein n=1 Tax=Acaryochloris thomasi RCC1774 TaxID=1764569 RepID=A0A2W1JEG0_9CYAN|nr:hypothetical protein [Acaryochloris thomasi]PZD72119.1 hypothetical protein C1752_04089 [Acaryochloris thomasi RCC1774]
MLTPILGFLLGSSAATGQVADVCAWTQEGSWADYQPGTLQKIEQELAPPKPEGVGQTPTGLPVKVTVNYSGESRPVSEVNRDAIATFAQAKQPPSQPNITELFTKEFRFTEAGKDYWLPLQKQMIPFLNKELSKGDSVQLLALWIGYAHPQGEVNHTFLVNEFCKL